MIVAEQWKANPQLQVRYGDIGHAKCIQDVTYNLSYLSQAISSDSPPLFASYIDWLKVLFQGLGIPTEDLTQSLAITSNVLGREFPKQIDIIQSFIDLGQDHLNDPNIFAPSFLDASLPLAELARKYLDCLIQGDRSSASHAILETVYQGVSVQDIYLYVFEPCQREIGRLWQMNQMSVAKEHYCTAATQMIMSQLYPRIFGTPRNGHSLVACCVGSELHEIGLRMVADFFEMDGWDTYYLGSSMPASGIIQAFIDHEADVLALSATMTYHLPILTSVIEQVRSSEFGNQATILVGGYPFNLDANLWKQVGADGCARNAQGAILAANALLDAKDK